MPEASGSFLDLKHRKENQLLSLEHPTDYS